MLLELVESYRLRIVEDLDCSLFPLGCFSLVNLEIDELFELEVEISSAFAEQQVNLRGAALGLELSFGIEEQLKLIEPPLTVLLLIRKFLGQLLALLVLE